MICCEDKCKYENKQQQAHYTDYASSWHCVAIYMTNLSTPVSLLTNLKIIGICHATNGPPKILPPDHLQQFFLPWVVPRAMYDCCSWSPQTIYSTISGPLYHRWSPKQQPFRKSLVSLMEGLSKALHLRYVKGKISCSS